MNGVAGRGHPRAAFSRDGQSMNSILECLRHRALLTPKGSGLLTLRNNIALPSERRQTDVRTDLCTGFTPPSRKAQAHTPDSGRLAQPRLEGALAIQGPGARKETS